MQQPENSQRDHHGRPRKASNRATLAMTLQLGSHPRLRSALSTHAILQHEKPDPDQQQRHKNLPHSEKFEESEIVQQEQRANPDQNNRSQRSLPAPVFKGIRKR